MSSISITKRLEWDSAHRVLRHESKCATLHGHRYAAAITVTAPELDDVGRVIDFSVIKTEVGGWIDLFWDHTTLVNKADTALAEFVTAEHQAGKRAPFFFESEPTAENIAKVLFNIARELLKPHGITLVKVEVWETPTSLATYAGDRR